MGRKRRNRILLSSTRLSVEPLENRALLAGVTADIPLSNSLTTDTAQVNTDAISSNTTGFPTNISVEAGDGQATVFWNSSNPTSYKYRVDVSLDGGEHWGLKESFDVSENPVSGIVELNNGFSYLLRVRDSINNLVSNTVTVTPMPPAIPGTPKSPINLEVTSFDKAVHIDWDIPQDEFSEILGVQVSWQRIEQYQNGWLGGGFSSQFPINIPPIVSGKIIDISLVNGEPYIINVRFMNSFGWGDYSNTIIATPLPGVANPAAPSAPLNLQAVAGNGEVTLSWQPPLSDGGYPITKYFVRYYETSAPIITPYWTELSVIGNSTVIRNLTGSEYIVRVAAENHFLRGDESGIQFSISSGEPVSPSAPRNLQAIAGDGNVTLSWDPPLSNGGSAVTEYQIAYSANGGSSWSYRYGTATTATLTLTNNVTYQFAVSAKNSVGWSDYSSTVTATPYDTPNTSPSAPRNLQAIAGDGNVTLSWDPPLSNGGSAVTEYKIAYSANGGSSWSYLYTTATSKNITGITNGITYVIRVAAINGIGVGTYSNQITVVAQAPDTKPSAPRNFQVMTGDREATFSWDVPLSNGGQPITGYRIELSEDEGATWTAHTTSSTSKNITGITNGIAYLARVAATNSLGVGSYSNQITVNTQVPATIPSEPRNFQALARDDGVTLSWDAPVSNGGATITGYQITYRAKSDTNWSTLFSTSASIALSDFTNGSDYHFMVSARNNIGTSDYLYEIVTLQTIPSITWHEQLGNTWLGDDPNQNLVVEFSSSTSRRNITKDTQSIGSLFQDKWEIFEAETILNKNILFARHLMSGCIHRFVANSDWAILGMSYIGNSGSEQLPRSARGSHYPVDTQAPQIPLDTQVPIEVGDNFTLRKSYSGSLFIDNLPLTSSDEPVRYNMHSGYRPVAADEIDGIKKILFVNFTGSSIVWDFESDGSNGVISTELTESDVEETRALENAFAVDINRDGFIGLPN